MEFNSAASCAACCFQPISRQQRCPHCPLGNIPSRGAFPVDLKFGAYGMFPPRLGKIRSLRPLRHRRSSESKTDNHLAQSAFQFIHINNIFSLVLFNRIKYSTSISFGDQLKHNDAPVCVSLRSIWISSIWMADDTVYSVHADSEAVGTVGTLSSQRILSHRLLHVKFSFGSSAVLFHSIRFFPHRFFVSPFLPVFAAARLSLFLYSAKVHEWIHASHAQVTLDRSDFTHRSSAAARSTV